MHGMKESVRSMGRNATLRARVVGHGWKDRALERRLEHAHEENEQLHNENELLREEIEETRSEHRQILDLLEDRIGGSSGRGGRLFLLLLMGVGAFAWMRMRNVNLSDLGWSGSSAEDTRSRLTA
jgi:hypothetical protein